MKTSTSPGKRLIKWAMIIVACLLGAFIVLAFIGSTLKTDCDDCTTPTADSEGLDTVKQANTDTQSPRSIDDIAETRRTLGSFTDHLGIHRVYVLIDAGLDDDRVAAIGRQLHAIDGDSWFYLMDSDSEFDAMLKALPETGEGNYENWPRDYVEKHFVARVMQLKVFGSAEGEGLSWIVEGGLDRPHLSTELP